MRLAALALFLALSASACTGPDQGNLRTDAAPPSGASRFEALGCEVRRVVDGDTIVVACPNQSTRTVRLTGYDTPETFRPRCASERARGRAATQRLRELLAGAETVDLRTSGTDRYGRLLGTLYLDRASVARRMIAEGHAVPYAGGRRIDWCA